MGINPKAVGATAGPFERSWDSRDVMLYALGVGAGLDELQFVTENSHDVELQVLPTFAVIAGMGGAAMSQAGDIDWGRLVHGAQSIRLHGPIPTDGTVSITDELTSIQDKGEGKHAILEVTAKAVDTATGKVLLENVTTAVIRGAGGFGGDPGPPAERVSPPDRAPDVEITYETRADQALIYRLSGDRNPLHSDPWFATELAGFPKPILHGLCTYGFTGRALLHGLCDGDPSRFGAMTGRFSSPVFPGESLTTRMWRDGDGAVFQTTASPDGRVVIDGGRFEAAR